MFFRVAALAMAFFPFLVSLGGGDVKDILPFVGAGIIYALIANTYQDE